MKKEKETIEPNPRGRPTKYCQEILDLSREYLDNCEDERYELIKTQGDTSTTYENKIKVKLPTIEGLALFLKINRDTLYEWEKNNKEISDIIKELRNKQCTALIDNGLSGAYNSTIAKVLLTKHGYREGIEQTGKDGVELIPSEAKKIEDAIDKVLKRK